MKHLTSPILILFDWHATLADTMDAMYAAMDDMLGRMDELGLIDRLTPPEHSKTNEDRRLVEFVQQRHRLHPKLKAAKRVSRTDIFEVLFGPDEEAKRIAHDAFNYYYRCHFGEVSPFEPGIREVIQGLKGMGIKVGILTNRVREFLKHELRSIEPGGWTELFDIVVSGDETDRLKPNPDPVFKALDKLDLRPLSDIWYVGDSTTDTASAKSAGITSIFYNGANWDRIWITKIFPGSPQHPHQPDYVVANFQELSDLVTRCWNDVRERQIAVLVSPRVILFDWHATLADTVDAMYRAVDDMLTQLDRLGLVDRLVEPRQSKNFDDRKLVEYVRQNYELHPKIKAARKISRTDIFEVLFGSDFEAKRIAHRAFNECYRHHYGAVEPFENRIREMLTRMRELGVRTGVLSNRDREFLEHELRTIDGSGWEHLFDTVVAGDDTPRRKPDPDPILQALANLDISPGADCWYVGDSTTDTVSAKNANITNVFYNGANWDKAWLARIFPGTRRHPHKPDIVVNDFQEVLQLVEQLLAKPQPHASVQ